MLTFLSFVENNSSACRFLFQLGAWPRLQAVRMLSSDVHWSARERVIRATFSDVWDGTRPMEGVAQMSAHRGHFSLCNLVFLKSIESNGKKTSYYSTKIRSFPCKKERKNKIVSLSSTLSSVSFFFLVCATS
jgi:hypothetical protein